MSFSLIQCFVAMRAFILIAVALLALLAFVAPAMAAKTEDPKECEVRRKKNRFWRILKVEWKAYVFDLSIHFTGEGMHQGP